MTERKSHNSSANGDKQPINSPKPLDSNQFPIIGIDLGISYWSAAVVQDGQVHVIPISGKNHLPAFIACLNNGFKFGNDAKQMFFDNREVTIFDLIYILGLNFNSGGELEEHMNDYSYAICYTGDKPKIALPNKVCEISIEKLFDVIINHLIYASEMFLNKTIHNVVVPIPVYFKESQKSALLKATTHVGIIELIYEPIAAAYAYRIPEKYKDENIDHYFLVYHLQEDNLDASIIQFTDNKFTIKNNIYERHLKKNYTFRFLDELCTQTYETYFISNPRFHPLNSGTLRYYCKTIFEKILHADSFEIEMDTIVEEKIVRTISRRELDDLLLVLVQESLKSVENVLREANLQKHDIDEVLLVGEVTKHRITRQQLKYFFGRNCLNCSLNPEDVLVVGAALRADILQQEICHNPKPFCSSAHSVDLEATEKTATVCLKQSNLKENVRKYASVCFDAEDRKQKQKFIKNDSIKKRKTTLSLRDNMFSMCTLFADAVSRSNLKTSVKEKLFFIPAYVRNKIKDRSKRIKDDLDLNQRDLCLEHKTPTENITNKNKQDKPKETLNRHEQTTPFDFPVNEPIFNANKLKYVLQRSKKVSQKQKNKQIYFENKCEPILECSDEDFCMLNTEYVSLNLIPEDVKNKKQPQEPDRITENSLINKINCVKKYLDMYYVILCFVVFLLHWASENICINIAIALISIATTLILNNRYGRRKIACN